jgi:hypothetical protein
LVVAQVALAIPLELMAVTVVLEAAAVVLVQARRKLVETEPRVKVTTAAQHLMQAHIRAAVVAVQVRQVAPDLVLLVALAVLDCKIQLLAHQFITLAGVGAVEPLHRQQLPAQGHQVPEAAAQVVHRQMELLVR